jgi:Cu(I)-responsive transcriptional regulator
MGIRMQPGGIGAGGSASAVAAGGGGHTALLGLAAGSRAGSGTAAPLPRPRGLNIGQAAARSGVSAKMIRHYEAIGLISAERRANGYRSYGPEDVAVLRFIRHARDLAFPLEDIRKLLALWRDRARNAGEVKRLALSHVEALEAKAAALAAMAQSLRHLAQNCHGDDRPDCPILDELEKPRG